MTDPARPAREPAVAAERTGSSEALRLAVGIPLVAAVLVFALGGAVGNLRPVRPSSVDQDVALPELLEPAGELESPPTVFRWNPGGQDAELAQVLVTDAGAERVWGSPPLPAGASEWHVSPSIFDGIGAGQSLYWRVREVRAGKPRSSSGLQAFRFLVDSNGFGPGEAPPGSSQRLE